MEYLDGGWMIKSGFKVDYAQSVYAVYQENDRLRLLVPFQPINTMGDTLDGGLLTLEIFSPRPGIIATRMYHFDQTQAKDPPFHLHTSVVHPKISITSKQITYASGGLRLVIDRDTLQFSYEENGRVIATTPSRAKALIYDANDQVYISDALALGIGEKIYGLGERFGNFVKNGQRIDIWNNDGGTSTEQAYKNVPFYVSSAGYGLFINTPRKVSFEVGSSQVSRVQFSVAGEEMTNMVIGGGSMKAVLHNYTDLTGNPSLPPAWSFGLWLSTSFTTDYTEKTVLSFVEGMAKRGIPLSVFHFDCLWMKPFQWCDFMWDKDKFPDPKGLLSELHRRGLRVCVWINPYIAQQSPLFKEAAIKGYLIKRTNGQVWQWDKWQAGMGIVDFTNPQATNWYKSQLRKLLEMGVDCFKTDFGERIPDKDIEFYSRQTPAAMHNYYTLLYNQAVYDVTAEVKGKKEALVFARSATVGSQTLPVHWGGDSNSTYASMAESLRAGLSFGMSGFGYWAHDISGFEDKADPDLYKRWTQFGLLSSHSRYHGSSQYKVPWLYGDEAVAVTKKFTQLKLALMPYLITMAHETSSKGLPMMRALALEFPNDLNTQTLDTAYMLGDSLYVAPIFNKTGQTQFYVPESSNVWTSLLDGKTYQGGKWYNEKFDYFNLPLLVRPNTMLITQPDATTPEGDYTAHPTLLVYEPTSKMSQELYDDQGLLQDTIQLCVADKELIISSQTLAGFELIVTQHGVQQHFSTNKPTDTFKLQD